MNKALIACFDALPHDEQDILLALSVIYTPVRQTWLQHLLRQSGCVSVETCQLVAQPLRDKFVNLGLMEITNVGWICVPSLSEILLKKAAEKPSFFNKLAPLVKNDLTNFSHHYAHLFEIRQLRISLYQLDTTVFISHLANIARESDSFLVNVLDSIIFKDFTAPWFNQLPLAIRMAILQSYLIAQRLNVNDCTLQYQLMNECFHASAQHSKQVKHNYIELHLIRGDIVGLEVLLEDDGTVSTYELMGVLRFMQNRHEESLICFDTAFKQLKKQTRKRNIFLDDFAGYFSCLALFRSQTTENLMLLKNQLQHAIKHHDPSGAFLLAEKRLLKGLDIYQGKTKARGHNDHLFFQFSTFAYDLLLYALLLYWLNELDEQIEVDPLIIKGLNKYCHSADQNNYFWFAAVSSSLLKRIFAADSLTEKIAEKYTDSTFNSIIDLIPRIEPWQRSLDALVRLSSSTEVQQESESKHRSSVRMIWMIDLINQEAHLTPREQRLGKNGLWTKGRSVAIKRLQQSPGEFDYLTDQDIRICSQIELGYENNYYSYYRKEVFQLKQRAVVEAIGHPHVYWSGANNYDAPVDISTAEIQLLVAEQEGQLLIALSPTPQDKENFIFARTASDDIVVYKIESQHHQVASILGQNGLLVPKKAKQQVIDSISSIASMLTVQSDIGVQSSYAEMVEVDSRLHLHLQSLGEGIQIDIFVQPFADGGPVYKPGIGGATVLAEIDGKQLQTTRNLKQEQQYLDQLIESCPGLYHAKNAKWILDDAEMALEVLLQLQTLGDFAVLEWPKGKAIKISRETGLSQAQFSVRKEKDWFSVSGEIHVDDNQVIEMQNLMGLLASTPGRFLKLEDGQIIALTQELRQRLDDFSGLGEAYGENLRFHPLAAQALDDITDGMKIKAGKDWRQQLTKLTEMADLNPQLPTTMQGELREYQRQGYQWLVRLAHLGAGACLADDMGLGKTIQALALILSRTTDGPTLILAPTSVCNNWLEEAQRFAPTLNVTYFGTGDRQLQLDAAGPFDLVVCSYGLLQTEAEKLVKKHWHTIVADEAQAIKNPQTKRSKAAMNLHGDFKIITTGTPIENHLGELWNLFNFINPGLLGTLKKFNERYAHDIENLKDHATQQRLKKLLQPFILRRLKNDVLTELPARTEVTLHIELSEDERSLYEALRRNAIQAMEDSHEQSVPSGQQHLKVLAEIMKLRRACCHPRLVLEQSDIRSSKLQAFEFLVDELISNHHKALVFSQFVTHLTLIRELLDKKGIRYQYLDGSTTMPKRKAAVNAFQSGNGDLFLISLKAGGAGLNLTAADYVVHMDPWWNPAVEDQASDRAHRMGQKRPVTIYRLVAKDTIEDKIVELHRHKRDLASRLLEGGDISSKMSVKDMLELIGASI